MRYIPKDEEPEPPIEDEVFDIFAGEEEEEDFGSEGEDFGSEEEEGVTVEELEGGRVLVTVRRPTWPPGSPLATDQLVVTRPAFHRFVAGLLEGEPHLELRSGIVTLTLDEDVLTVMEGGEENGGFVVNREDLIMRLTDRT